MNFLKAKSKYQKFKDNPQSPWRAFQTTFMTGLAGLIIWAAQTMFTKHEETKKIELQQSDSAAAYRKENRAWRRDLDLDIDSIKEQLKHKK